mmetsp:Transcript_65745/g.147733  ORF Transcript_65745/g.147733 Transcript_65745/m.147733 type:complete len:388 (-) Transcript_65745:181-1344(-)
MSWVAVDQQLVGAATWAEKLVELIEHHKGKQRPEDETGGEYVPDHAVCTHPELHRQPKATGTTKASRPQHALPQGHAQHEEAPLEDEPREEGVLPAHPPKVAQGDDGLDYVEAEYHDGGKGERDPQAATEASPYLFAHARRFAPRRRCWRHSMVLCRGVGLFLLILLLLLVLVAFHGLLLLLLLLTVIPLLRLLLRLLPVLLLLIRFLLFLFLLLIMFLFLVPLLLDHPLLVLLLLQEVPEAFDALLVWVCHLLSQLLRHLEIESSEIGEFRLHQLLLALLLHFRLPHRLLLLPRLLIMVLLFLILLLLLRLHFLLLLLLIIITNLRRLHLLLLIFLLLLLPLILLLILILLLWSKQGPSRHCPGRFRAQTKLMQLNTASRRAPLLR